MTPPIGHHRRSARALLAALALILSLPGATLGGGGYNTSSISFVESTGAVGGVTFTPLINSGETLDDVTFQGLPDGLGVVPGDGWVDVYVAHEESHVPFGLTPTTVFADFQDSSVTRVRVDLATKSILEMEVALPASAGLIRFCSAFMAGPEHGFPSYTFLLNEESNDVLPVPAGAPYGADAASVGPGQRQAGYAVYLDTASGAFDVIPGAGRHNHENTVVVPGGWERRIVSLSGDDTFTSTSSPEMPNLSQLYMYDAKDSKHFLNDNGALWGFRVTGTDDGPVDPADPFNDANDFFEISVGDAWTGEFIKVNPAVARGQTPDRPQDALEIWSNDNNVFQFIRVEDIAYDPDDPRVVYFADTGNSRLLEDGDTGRLWRAPPGTPDTLASSGRIFRMVLNEDDPRIVDEFSVVVEASAIGMRAPDNLDAGHNSLMVQEDASNALVWMWDYGPALTDWTAVARVDRDANDATSDTGESSGIIDASEWFGDGWWALDVQAHDSHVILDPTTADPATWYTWTTPPIPPGGAQYRKHLEAGQLLLMFVPGS
jgi:hypothetical protein